MFIRPEEVLMDLSRTYKTKTFGLADVIEWCMQVECDHICDIDIMEKYELKTIVTKGRITLPINVYRILVIYDESGHIIKTKAMNGLYIHGLHEYNGHLVTMEFIGVPMDEDCIPLIAASHKEACKKYCIMQLFADESETNMNMYKIQQNRSSEFAGLCIKAKQGFREWTVDAIAALSRHSYNEPFKDHMRRYADRMGVNTIYSESIVRVNNNSVHTHHSNHIPESSEIRNILDEYIALINSKIEDMPYTKSMTFKLGVDGSYIGSIWNIPITAVVGINTFENSNITIYEDNMMIIVPVECTATNISLDLSAVYDSLKVYTIAVTPPTN